MPLETSPCDTCGSEERTCLFAAPDHRHGGTESFRVVRCARCAHVYVCPRPTVESLAAYYPPPAAYAAHRRTSRLHASWMKRVAFNGGRLGRPIATAHNLFAYHAMLAPDGTRPGTMLDVGCGTGGFMREWQALGWDVTGIEMAKEAAHIARDETGSAVHVGAVEDIALPPESFDLVTMSHSLEHLPSPRRALERIRTWLRPRGRLLVIVPNFASANRRVFGERWYGLELPRHLHHFEPDTLRAALERAGFLVEGIHATAHAELVLQNLRDAFLGAPQPGAARPPAALRALATAVLLPLAVARLSSSLWAVARAPDRLTPRP